jgi:hypothetical protein
MPSCGIGANCDWKPYDCGCGYGRSATRCSSIAAEHEPVRETTIHGKHAIYSLKWVDLAAEQVRPAQKGWFRSAEAGSAALVVVA